MQFVVSAALLASVKRTLFSATHPPKSTLFDFYNFPRARLKSSTRISSVVLLTLRRRFSAIPRSTSRTSLKSTWSVSATRISYRQTCFLLFIGKEPNKSINSDETVVYGFRSPSRHPLHRYFKKTQDLLLLDFAPLLPQYRY